MRAVFRPGFTIVDYLYDNPSSGGAFIVTPGTPGVSYIHEDTQLIYMYIEDGEFGTGWYYIGDEGLVYDPSVDVNKLTPQ